MSRRAYAFIACLFLALFALPATAGSLLQNPGFEEVQDGLPVGWSHYGGNNEYVSIEMSDDTHSGDNAVRLIDTSPEERRGEYAVGVTQDVPTEGGNYYRGAVWVKVHSANHSDALHMQLRFLPSNTIAQVALDAEPEGGWEYFQVIEKAPEGTTGIRCYLYTMHYWQVDALVDDAVIEQMDVDFEGIRSVLLTAGSMGIEEPRELNLRTPVVENGQAAARILVPEGLEDQGQRIADAIADQTDAEIPVTTDYAGTVESEETIIALGNLNNNKMIERLYFNKYLEIDSLKPGEGEYILQIVHEPYNGPTGKNVIVIGASDDAGLQAGVGEFIQRLPDTDDIVFEEPLIYASNHTTLSEQAAQELLETPIGKHALREFWSAAQVYRDTGDLAYARRAKQILLHCGDRFVKDPEYSITWPEETTSNMLGAMWDVLEEASVFTPGERLECTNILLMVLYETKRHVSGWSGLADNDTIIWNHTTFPLMGVYWLSRYFRRFYGDVDGRMDDYLARVHAAFEGQVTSWKPQEDSLGYYSIVPDHTIEYTLAENDYRYFENGSVLKHVEYTAGICDNTGDAGGFGDSGYGHGPYVRNMHWAVWYYKDGRVLWWLNRVLLEGFENPYDQTIEETPWTELAGVNVYELHPQVYAYTRDKTYYGGPPSPPNVPEEKAFDKISFRQNLEADGEYFLLDGYARGKHLQYDGNAIIKYYADGEDWLIDGDYLVRNTTDHNMVSVIKDGRCEELIPTCTALEAVGDLPSAGLTQTRVHEYNGTDWTRNIYWIKGEFAVVTDVMEALEPGSYSFLGNWKTLAVGEQELSDERIFSTVRQASGGTGSRDLLTVENPAEGVEAGVSFTTRWARLDTAVDLPAGEYEMTLYAQGTGSGSDSFYVTIGGERKAFHIPVDHFGPSSSSWTKEEPTPSVETTHSGPQKISISLREGAGPILDRFVLKDEEGNVVAEVEAENAPPLPEEDIEVAPEKRFFVKNDGHASSTLSGRINHVGMHITYMRNRFGGSMKSGDRACMHNLIYHDTSDAPGEYDIKRMSDTEAIVYRSGEPVAVCGSAEAVKMDQAPGTKMAMATRDTYILVGSTGVEGLFSAQQPVSVEIDLEEETATISGPGNAVMEDPAGTPLLSDDGRVVVDCSDWGHLRRIRDTVERFFGNARNVVEEPTSERAEEEQLPGMSTLWSAEIPLQEAESEIGIGDMQPADFDGDGAAELLVLRGRTTHCLDADGSVLWTFATDGICGAVEVADLQGDGTPEILLGSDDEHIYVLDTGGTLITSHHCDVPLRVGTSSVREPNIANIVVADLEDDGTADVIVGTRNGNLMRYTPDFEMQWRYDGIPHGTRELRVVDLDGDGEKEILAANKYGHVQIFNVAGDGVGRVYSELGDVEMAVGNLDEDAAYEIANGSSTGTFTCQEFNGAIAFHFNNYGFAFRELVMEDVLPDTADELLAGSETGYAYVLDGTGEVLAQRNFGAVVTDLTPLEQADGSRQVALSCADGKVYLADGNLDLQRVFDAGEEIVLLGTLRDGENLRLLVATGGEVMCLDPAGE